jgi:hypothetical protein
VVNDVKLPQGEAFSYTVHLVVYVFDAVGGVVRSSISSLQHNDSNVTVRPPPASIRPIDVLNDTSARLTLRQPAQVLLLVEGLGQMLADGRNSCSTSGYSGAVCDIPPSPVDGVWTDYSSFGKCSLSCAGVEVSMRNCSLPLYGGLPCVGSDNITRACTDTTCPTVVHGGYSPWSSWSSCNSSCPGSTIQGYFPGQRF